MIYKKPSVKEGWWAVRVFDTAEDGSELEIQQQWVDEQPIDHYRIVVNGRNPRKTYFGESAHFDVASDFNGRVHWTRVVHGMDI